MEKIEWKIAKATRRMQRRREKNAFMRIAAKVCAVAILTGAVVMFSGAAQQPATGRITVEHTVQKGETLWSIAEAHCGDVYILEYLHDIKKNNPSVADGRIYPGQIIKLVKE